MARLLNVAKGLPVPTAIVAMTVRSDVRTTDTEPALTLYTYAVAESGLKTTFCGPLPTPTTPVTAFSEVDTTDTLLLFRLVT